MDIEWGNILDTLQRTNKEKEWIQIYNPSKT